MRVALLVYRTSCTWEASSLAPSAALQCRRAVLRGPSRVSYCKIGATVDLAAILVSIFSAECPAHLGWCLAWQRL